MQLLYRTSHEDGERLVSDPRTGATGYTGSRSAGLKLKAAADAAGKPIYLELSAVNPVLMLPGALAERGNALVDEFVASSLMGTGQFCTNPSLVLLVAGEATEQFIAGVRARFDAAAPTPLLSSGVLRSLGESVATLQRAGATLVTGGATASPGYRFGNTLLRVSGDAFLAAPEKLQTEAFGNAALFVVARDAGQLAALVETLEGSLTGGFYSDTRGADDALYARLEPLLRPRVGRLLNDKMPTGVAVSPAMNHGGPYPSTGHPGFTAVGIPAALRRFAMLQCYDNVRPSRLPALLRDQPPNDSGLPPDRRRVAPRPRVRRLRPVGRDRHGCFPLGVTAAASGLRRHAKYWSSTRSEPSLGTGPVFGVPEKYRATGWLSLNAGHVGRPSPLGSPRFAKLVQYVAIASEIRWSSGVTGLPVASRFPNT